MGDQPFSNNSDSTIRYKTGSVTAQPFSGFMRTPLKDEAGRGGHLSGTKQEADPLTGSGQAWASAAHRIGQMDLKALAFLPAPLYFSSK